MSEARSMNGETKIWKENFEGENKTEDIICETRGYKIKEKKLQLIAHLHRPLANSYPLFIHTQISDRLR